MDPRLVIITSVYEDYTASLMLFQELRRTVNKNLLVGVVDDGSIRELIENEH